MKVIVVSDTHGINQAFISNLKDHKDAQLIIHLGDMVDDVEEIKKYTDIPVIAVRGNNDYYDSEVEWDQELELLGHKIFVTHGHNYRVHYGIENLLYKAEEVGAELAIYGHTHVYFQEDFDGITILNPGSAGYDRGMDGESFVILDISKEKILIDRILI